MNIYQYCRHSVTSISIENFMATSSNLRVKGFKPFIRNQLIRLVKDKYVAKLTKPIKYEQEEVKIRNMKNRDDVVLKIKLGRLKSIKSIIYNIVNPQHKIKSKDNKTHIECQRNAYCAMCVLLDINGADNFELFLDFIMLQSTRDYKIFSILLEQEPIFDKIKNCGTHYSLEERVEIAKARKNNNKRKESKTEFLEFYAKNSMFKILLDQIDEILTDFELDIQVKKSFLVYVEKITKNEIRCTNRTGQILTSS